ncbi:unnamed protein product [Rotaria sp. Silwood1]|nr:unnamed protein product [Rotaria sp. Silwood1]
MNSELCSKITTAIPTNPMNMLLSVEGSITLPLSHYLQLESFYYKQENRNYSSIGTNTTSITKYQDAKCQTNIVSALVSTGTQTDNMIISIITPEAATVKYDNETSTTIVVDSPSSSVRSTEKEISTGQIKNYPPPIDVNKNQISSKQTRLKKSYAIKSTIRKRLLTSQTKATLKIDQASAIHVSSSSESLNAINERKITNDLEKDNIKRMNENDRREKFRFLARVLNELANIDSSNSDSHNMELIISHITNMLHRMQ